MDTDRKCFKLLAIAAPVVGVVAVVLAAVWTGKFQGGLGWGPGNPLKFNFHPMFMVIGLIFIYGEAILAYRVLKNKKRMFVKVVHMLMQLTALCLAIVAVAAVFSSHNDKSRKNLYSIHSWLGLATVIMFGLQFILGFVFYLYPQMNEFLKIIYLPAHRYWGVVIFCMATTTALMGIAEYSANKTEIFTSRSSEAYVINFMGVCIVVHAWLVTYLVHKPEYKNDEVTYQILDAAG